ncbi:hypothetical protein ACH5RR_038235 [Cinchona calisaya]|uniref:Zinc finger PHD-type domain-containing protein n=1 Tax=Cinchona calisaya TaxID=153742 RepID=A0ABD2Y017_9GENT
MKSRSHRLPTSSVDPPRRYVWAAEEEVEEEEEEEEEEGEEEEESWTVDCVCGVNFDDGEEMVNCDECGVWVHTRCSRYVKSEKSFACHKCKKINYNTTSTSRNIPTTTTTTNNDSEETEVAQLLVELPTKTLRMDHYPPPPSSYKPSAFPPPRSRPFSLWTGIPIEERVHVQGIPGGDPALFSGLSPIFGPQLWKCTGYVPKKFNVRYREFPSWDDEELEKDVEKKNNNTAGESHNNADNGTGDLFSLSKENDSVFPVPKADSVGLENQAEDAKTDTSPKEATELEEGEKNSDVSRPENEAKKDRSLLQAPVIHFSKRKKDDVGIPKDKSGRKKSRIMEKGDFKNRCSYPPGTASTNSSDAKRSQFSEDRGSKAVQVDPHCGKSGNSSHSFPAGQLSHESGIGDHVIDAHKSNLGSTENGSGKSSFDAPRHNSSSTAISKEANGGQQVPVKLEDSSKTIYGSALRLGKNDSGHVATKEEKSELIPEDLTTARPGTEINEDAPDTSINMVTSCLEVHAKAKRELDDAHAKAKRELDDAHMNLIIHPPPLYDAKLGASGTLVKSHEILADFSSENARFNDASFTASEVSDRKVGDVVRRSDGVDIRKDGVDGEAPVNHCQPDHDTGDLDGSLEAKKISEGFASNSAVELSTSSLIVRSPRVATDEGKVIAPVGNLSSASENCVSESNQNHNMDSHLKGMPESSFAGGQDIAGASTEVVKDEGRHERARKLVKELPKSSRSSMSKSSHLKRFSQPSVSKRISSDSKDSMVHSSSLPSPLQQVASNPSSESANVLQPENASNIQKKSTVLQTETAPSMQKKVPGSVSSQKGEKINQSVTQSLSKVNTTLTHAATSSNSPATLSDEELALLLHQELNSSPRVPRVPRMRHAGSLPQLTSPTATSTLMKRTSSTGGKDHGLTSRRKTKDLAKDGSHSSREMDDEAKKTERVSPSIDHGRQDSTFASDTVSKREADSGSANGVYSRKKSNAPSGATSGSGLSSPTEGNEHNLLSNRHSPRIPSDDEKGVVGRHTHRTLPGLLAEIMKKGQRMTYEELCNAVLPHWPNLRKHNGERYAYSSHSQAVLDCLRNRNEWARLVDRGPKTSGGRKKRKLDADPAGVDSEDNDDSRERSTKDMRRKTVESHHEEFPKGKRKARKRRRLALQGRGIKDVRRRQRRDEVSDDEVGSFSDSSEETMFSEDEMEGCGMSASGNEVSASSDGTGNI